MRRPHGTASSLFVIAALCLPAVAQNTSIRSLRVLNSRGAIEIEIEASDRITPETQVLTGPDRLVVDFPNATPGAELRSQSVDRGEVKSVRVGLFRSKPPVTRVVFDLKAPQSYQVFPYGRTVMIKMSAAVEPAEGVDYFPADAHPALMNTSFAPAKPLARAEAFQTGPDTKPSLEVSFREGQLSIRANKASLSEVLFAVHQRTGAEVALTAGVEREQVVADLGPAPAPEVLARLLKGSSFNFLILSSAADPKALERVILSPRSGGLVSGMASMASNEVAEYDASRAGAAQATPTPPGPDVLPERPAERPERAVDENIPN
jgi:hypothetical protein